MKKIVKILIYLIIALILLTVIGYFILTSSFALKHYILPYASKASGYEITTNEITVSPLSGKLYLKDFSITKANELDAKIGTLDCEFNLISILSTKIVVNKLLLENTNIDLTTSVSNREANEAKKVDFKNTPGSDSGNKETNPLKLPYLDIKDFNIKNFNFNHKMIRDKGKNNSTTSIKDLNINSKEIKTGQSNTINLDADIRTLDSANKELINGDIDGVIKLSLNDDSVINGLNLNSLFNFNNDKKSKLLLDFITKENGAKNPFELKTTITDLPVDPILSFTKTYKKSNGEINSANINFSGPDLNNIDPMKEGKGSFDIDIKNLYLPTELMNNEIGQIILLPLNVVGHLNTYLKNDVTDRISDIVKQSLDVASGVKTMNFQTGKVQANIDNGEIFIRQCLFDGDSDSVVQKLSLQGYVHRNKNIELKTNTQITAIALPINIYGTLDKPSPDVTMLIPAILGKNVKNVLKFAKDGAVKVGDKTIDLGSFASGQLDQTINKNKKDVDKLVDSVSNFFN